MVPEIQAEAYFILGRNSHAHGNVDDALPYYTQACKIWPRFALAQFRLAQVFITVSVPLKPQLQVHLGKGCHG